MIYKITNVAVIPVIHTEFYIRTYTLCTHAHTLSYSHLCRLFELAPDLINLFPFELNEDSQDGLKKHALQVMQSIDMAIGMLDDQNELEDTLTELGIIHNMKSVQLESFAVSFVT